MSGTRRTPLARRSAATITPLAVQIFNRIRVLATECTCGPQDESCPACEAWWAELGLRPWRYPPAAEDPERDVGWERSEEGMALWRALEEAAREPEPRRGRRKRARREPEPVV